MLSLNYAGPREIYLYRELERKAKREQQRYSSALRTIDTVIGIYEVEHQDLVRECKKVRTEIFVNTQGLRDSQGADLPDTLYTEKTMSQTTTNLYLCKAVFRKLAQQLHPDRQGGDAELFQRVLQAYRKADVHQLRAIAVVLNSSKCLAWIKNEGIKFWQDYYTRLVRDLAQLQSSEVMLVSRLHMQGRKAEASSALEELLRLRKYMLEQELLAVLTKGST